MPRKPRNKRAENLADFAGPDADHENIEKLAKAAAESNSKIGHNSGEPSDEVLKRNADAIEVAWVEIDAAMRIVQAARAGLAVARKNAKTDFGAKSWVDSVEAAIKLKRAADKGGSSEIVSEHRQIGRALRVMGCALGTQFNLFASPADDVAPKDEKTIEAEATLAGEHAGLNGEPKENNPHQAGTPQWFGWNNGHTIGVDKLADGFRNGGAPTSEAAAH